MATNRYLSHIFIEQRLPQRGQKFYAQIRFGMVIVPCQIGRLGSTSLKREGDGKTPRGLMHPIRGFWRMDRKFPPRTGLAMRPLRHKDGWCDAPSHGQYNRLIRRPFSASHEELWRQDPVYDVVIELDWNKSPRIMGRGSAIFLHLTREEEGNGTAGCIAVDKKRIETLLAKLSSKTRIIIR